MGAIVQYYNLTGGLNTIAGIGTINQGPKRTESPDMQNVEFYKLGGLQSMEGNTQFSKTLLTAPVALGHEYIYEDRKYLLVVTTDGEVWEYDRVTDEFVSLNTEYGFGKDTSIGRKIFETATSRYSAVNFNNGVVLTNGVDDLIYYKKNRHIKLSGNVSGSLGSNQITGNLTTFKTELHKGDLVSFGVESNTYYIVEMVESNTTLLLSEPLVETITDGTVYLGPFSYCNAMMIDSTNVENEEDVKDLIGPPIRGLAIQAYQGRLWVGGTDGILYYSEVGLYNGWDIKFGAGNFPEFYNDTSAFTALALWDKVLVVCKRERTYLLDGTASDDTAWKIEPYSVNTVESQQSWIDCNNGLWGFSKRENGIYPILQRTIYNAYFGGNDLSLKISDTFDYINQAKYDEIFPVYHAKKGYIMFYIPLLTGLGSNDCFCWDTRSKSWLHRKVPQEVTTAFEFNNEVYIGTKDGKVLKEFIGLTFDGEPIEFWWKSPWFYFGDSTNNKTTKEFRIKISEEATNKFKIRNRRDGRDVFKSRNITNNLDAFTGLVWDIDYQEGDLNPEYKTTREITKVVSTQTEDIYYTTEIIPLANTIPLGTLLYKDINCEEVAGLVGSFKNRTEVLTPQEATNSRIEYNTYFSITTRTPKYYKYNNSNDEIIWTDFFNKVPSVGDTVKFSKIKKSQKLEGYYLPFVTTVNGKYEYYKVPLDTPKPWINQNVNMPTPPNNQWEMWVYMKDNSMEFTGTPNRFTFVTSYSAIGNVKGTDFTKLIKPYYTTIATGTDDVNEAGDFIVVSVTETSNGVYNITLDNGTAINGLSLVGTDGIQNVSVYSKTNKYNTEPTIYQDSECKKECGTWTSNNRLVFNNGYSSDVISVVSYLSEVIKYYREEVIEFTSDGILEVNDPRRITLNPNYSGETLTDTVWDEDSWVISRQITKRFPLPDQYFETMQIEFYGNATDEGMAIYGFEIDGVELEEVPVR